jgi:hypothetical protein
MLPDLLLEIVRATSRVLSGRLLTSDQIGAVTGNVVGQYFADWLGTPEDEREAAKRVEDAKDHLAKATRLISSLKTDLDAETRKLEEVVAVARTGVEPNRPLQPTRSETGRRSHCSVAS